MAIVYQHTRNDTGAVFYIGIGMNDKRPYSQESRNTHWKNVVGKAGYTVTVLFDDINWSTAVSIEKYLIRYHGRSDKELGPLVNKTDGGEGASGIIISEDQKQKISAANKGKKFTLGYKHTKETLLKMSIANKGKNNPMYGKVVSQETRAKRSEAFKGINNHKSKKVIDTATNTIYVCVTEAAKAFGISNKLLYKWLSGRNPNKTTLKYL